MPSVSIVVVNHNGRDYLEPCLDSLLAQNYDGTVEILLVDNNSSDGSVELVRERYPQVRLIENPTNTGFAPAVNQAARVASGEILALINNDAIADPRWVVELVLPMLADPKVAATGALVLDGEGTTVDFAGGQLTFYGHGLAAHHGEVPPDDLKKRPTIFATGAAMATRRSVFLEAGGFDDDFFAFFEDVDYGWRLWVLGHEVWFIPSAVVRHLHHGTIQRFGYPRERYLLERNALATIFKNYGDDLLSRALPAATVLSLLRGFGLDTDSDLGDFNIVDDSATHAAPEPRVSSLTGAHLAALRDFGLSIDRLMAKRTFVQKRRRRDDREIVRLFRQPTAPNVDDPTFLSVFHSWVDAFDLTLHATSRQRVLIVTADTLGPSMAGPAIRAWEMARTLAVEHEVVLASVRPPTISADNFKLAHITAANAKNIVGHAEVIVTQGPTMHHFPEIARSDASVVVDLYDPFHVEGLVMRKDDDPAERWATARSDLKMLQDQLERGDLLLCASPKQRDFWLGHLAGAGRINPATYDQNPDLTGLLDIAPFGLPADPPQQSRHAIKGVVDGISEDDIVVLWGGGIYNWFDPATLIRALHIARADDPRLKLFFLGTTHPNPDSPEMHRAVEARRVAEELGLAGKHVFFNDGWVPYDDRANYLLDADIGVSTHFSHVETELSYRTRILDYIWAGLPILCTEGDSLANLVEQRDLGETVPAENVDAIAAALIRLAHEDRSADIRANIESVRPELTWARALAPLVEFCRLPGRAADVTRPGPRSVARSPVLLARRFAAVAQDRGFSSAVRAGMASLRLRWTAMRSHRR